MNLKVKGVHVDYVDLSMCVADLERGMIFQQSPAGQIDMPPYIGWRDFALLRKKGVEAIEFYDKSGGRGRLLGTHSIGGPPKAKAAK